MKREENLETLEAVIARILKRYNLEDKYNEQSLADAWRKLLGDVIHRKTQSVHLKGRKLIVKLESSVIREELTYAKDRLIEQLNETVGKDLVDEVELR